MLWTSHRKNIPYSTHLRPEQWDISQFTMRNCQKSRAIHDTSYCRKKKTWNMIMKYIKSYKHTEMRNLLSKFISLLFEMPKTRRIFKHLIEKEEKMIGKMFTIHFVHGNWHGFFITVLHLNLYMLNPHSICHVAMFHVWRSSCSIYWWLLSVPSAPDHIVTRYAITLAQIQWQTNEHIISVKMNIEHYSFSLRLRFPHYNFHNSMLGINLYDNKLYTLHFAHRYHQQQYQHQYD